VSGASDRYTELAAGPRSELARLFTAGEAPSVEAISEHEFRGYNQPWFMSLLGIRKFIKAFFHAEGSAFGCNTPVDQNGLEAEWNAKPDDQRPKRYAFYEIEPAAAAPSRKGPTSAICLDYGRGRNPWYDPSRLLRDYVVRIDADSDDLLLGKAYAALGPLRIPLSFFLLERYRPLTSKPELPPARS
jgi:hypothetical protein